VLEASVYFEGKCLTLSCRFKYLGYRLGLCFESKI